MRAPVAHPPRPPGPERVARVFARVSRVVFVVGASTFAQGCMVPVPEMPTVTDAHVSLSVARPLAPSDQVIVIAANPSRPDEEQAVDCVARRLRKARPPIPVIPLEVGRRTVMALFEGALPPRSNGQLRGALGRADARASVARSRLRHIVLITARRSPGRPGGPGDRDAGAAAWVTNLAAVRADVWDLAGQHYAGSLGVSASLTEWGTIAGPIGVFALPLAQELDHACKTLANAIAAQFRGTEPPSDLVRWSLARRSALLSRASQGDTHAAFVLADEYGRLDELQALARQGDRRAAEVLAREHDVARP